VSLVGDSEWEFPGTFDVEGSPFCRLEDDGVRDKGRPRGLESHEEAEAEVAEVSEDGPEGPRWEEFPDCELVDGVEASDKSVEPD